VIVTSPTPVPWRPVLERLRHPDVWGPGGLYPLEAFRRTRRGWAARCPSSTHPDRHPSFSMPEGRSFGHCFACGYTRTWIGFVLERQGHSPAARGRAFMSALAVLAERAGCSLDTPGALAEGAPAGSALTTLAALLKRGLVSEHPRAVACRAYLAARGVPEGVLARLPLGAWTDARELTEALRADRVSPRLLREHGLLARYVPEHPLLFLYEDAAGVTGFKCRKPSLTEKSVLNAVGFGGAVEARSLFGLSVARDAITQYRRAILVEGEFDALGWYAASLAAGRHFELVALGGTAKPSVERFGTLRSLGARVVYLALDADPPGETATATACRCAWEAGLDVAILPMPDGCKDPDEVLARHGAEAGARRLFALDRAAPGGVWLAQYQLRRSPPVTVEATAALREASAEVARVMPAPDRARYAEIIGKALGVPASSLEVEWGRFAATARAREIRDRLQRWALDWAGRLDRHALTDHLEEASTRLSAARAELGTSMDNHLPSNPRALEPTPRQLRGPDG
jgi:DNA primase